MKHKRGRNCDACCCSGPFPCDKPGCEGWVHQEVVDEVQVTEDDWEWVHNYRCDTCNFINYVVDYNKIEFENDGETIASPFRK